MARKKRRKRTVWVGVDVGGTSMRAAAVTPEGEVLAEADTKTRLGKGHGAVLEQTAALVRDLCDELACDPRDLPGVGVGVPGSVDPTTGVVCHAPNLGWAEVPFGGELAEDLGVPVVLENDVNVAVLGEHRFGAAVGEDSALGVWIGTGIGGGLVLGGRLHRGARGSAAEIGHTLVLPDGPTCGCGNRGCVEALASRTALEAEILRRVERGGKSVVPKLLRSSRRQRLTSGVLHKALGKGDELVAAVIAQSQRYLGLALATWINVVDPACVVLGGGVVEKLGERYVDPVVREVRQYVFRAAGPETRIVPAALGDLSGIMGAASLVEGLCD